MMTGMVATSQCCTQSRVLLSLLLRALLGAELSARGVRCARGAASVTYTSLTDECLCAIHNVAHCMCIRTDRIPPTVLAQIRDRFINVHFI